MRETVTPMMRATSAEVKRRSDFAELGGKRPEEIA